MKTERIKSDKVEIHAQKQVEKKTVKLGESFLRSGHTCFEINTKTLECQPAKYEPTATFNGGVKSVIIVKEDCVYVNALNKKNALKVYKRDFVGMDRVFNQTPIYSKIDIASIALF
jgi:tRNA(Ile2) C34 agmatinyltransferase TiaS